MFHSEDFLDTLGMNTPPRPQRVGADGGWAMETMQNCTDYKNVFFIIIQGPGKTVNAQEWVISVTNSSLRSLLSRSKICHSLLLGIKAEFNFLQWHKIFFLISSLLFPPMNAVTRKAYWNPQCCNMVDRRILQSFLRVQWAWLALRSFGLKCLWQIAHGDKTAYCIRCSSPICSVSSCSL